MDVFAIGQHGVAQQLLALRVLKEVISDAEQTLLVVPQVWTCVRVGKWEWGMERRRRWVFREAGEAKVGIQGGGGGRPVADATVVPVRGVGVFTCRRHWPVPIA
eukprot:82641-Chlamydomonas_euryale.AAC.2